MKHNACHGIFLLEDYLRKESVHKPCVPDPPVHSSTAPTVALLHVSNSYRAENVKFTLTLTGTKYTAALFLIIIMTGTYQQGIKTMHFSETVMHKQASNITQCHVQMPWLWSCTTSRHQNPSEQPSCTLPYLMEAMESSKQYGFSHFSAEEHLENKLK